VAQVSYLFIFLTPGCDPAVHRAVIDTPAGPTTVVGASDVDQTCAIAAAAVAAGEADIIELCGAYHEEGCRQVTDAVGGTVPVGYVTYFPGDGERVDALFA
jgi:hypothetical protein